MDCRFAPVEAKMTVHCFLRGQLIAKVTFLAMTVSCVAGHAQSNSKLDALNKQAEALYDQGNYAAATEIAKRAVAIAEKNLGPEHPAFATTLNNLAFLYRKQGRSSEAEPLYRRALEIRLKTLSPEHPDIVNSLNNLSYLYRDQGEYRKAEPLLKNALAIRMKALGSDHPDVGSSLSALANLYGSQGRNVEAEALYKRALAIFEAALGPDHPTVARSLDELAQLYESQGRKAEAEALHKRAMMILDKPLSNEHRSDGLPPNKPAKKAQEPVDIDALEKEVDALQQQGRHAEAIPFAERLVEQAISQTGPESLRTALSMHVLARAYLGAQRYFEAEPLLKQLLSSYERGLVPSI
jgi:tetratricopeptide (TPR) repeat protein